MQLLYKISLDLLCRNVFYLTESEYFKFQSKCNQEQGTSEDWDKILSCVFIPERSSATDQKLTYNFFHKSVMEYYAGRYLADNLRTALEDGKLQVGEDYIWRTISEVIIVTGKKIDPLRYGNLSF